MEFGLRFKALYRSMAWNRGQAAKFLRVSERTLHNWETGRHEVPFAVIRLLRILAGYELPGRGWDGWHMHSGKLWSPEGHGFSPGDSSWWSLLVRRAQSFQSVYEENARLRMATRVGASKPPAAARPAAPQARLDLSWGHFGTGTAPLMAARPVLYRFDQFNPGQTSQRVAT